MLPVKMFSWDESLEHDDDYELVLLLEMKLKKKKKIEQVFDMRRTMAKKMSLPHPFNWLWALPNFQCRAPTSSYGYKIMVPNFYFSELDRRDKVVNFQKYSRI